MKAILVHRLSALVLVALSLVALGAVLSGFGRPLPHDEGAAAHLFQLSIVALLPVGLVFLGTADWSRPRSNIRPLAIPAAIVAVAFTALYLLEHRG